MPLSYDTPIRTNAQSLDRVLAVGLPLLLSFEIPQCDPCRELDEPFKLLAKVYAGQALIVRVEDARESDLLTRFLLSRAPTLLLWKGGREVGRIEGAVEFSILQKNLEYLAGKNLQPALGSGRSIAIPGAKTSPPHQASPASAQSSQTAVSPLVVTDASFDQDVLRSSLPVLVDFWAPWCGPCRMVSPLVEELGREYIGRLRVAKVNTDDNPRQAGRLGIQGIPTLILFKNGREVERLTGAAPKQVLKQFVDRNL